MRFLIGALLIVSVIAGCAGGGVQLDERTGKLFPESPTAPRDFGLKYYSVTLFGQYRVAHAYIDGVNVRPCYSGADSLNVRFEMLKYLSGETYPAYLMNRRDIVARSGDRVNRPAKHELIGQRITTTRYGEWVDFDSFCGDRTAGGGLSLGIRDKRSWTIEQVVAYQEEWTRLYNADEIARGTKFRSVRQPTERVIRNGNEWVYLRENSATAPGMDEGEIWMLPVADSNYYIYLSYGYMAGARAANDPEYMRIRALVEQIIDSFKIEKL